MSPREKRRDRRDWRSGVRRKIALTIGWLALLVAIASMTAYFVVGSTDALIGAVGAAIMAMLLAWVRPELEQRGPQRLIFSPWQGESEPSLARQLLTLP